MKGKKLNARQARFVDEYLIDLNATQAAVRAGYSKKTAEQIGYQLLQKASVTEAIARKTAKRIERVELTQDWVLTRLRENTERAMQAVPVMAFDHASKQMVETGTWEYEGAVANRAVELIGKHLGMFTEKHEHRFPDLPREQAVNRVAMILAGAKSRQSSNGNGNGNGTHAHSANGNGKH